MLADIRRMRKDLRHVLRTPRRWEGGLRRSALARAIRGSNSIEGYQVGEDDAAAALDDEEPISADERTFLEIQGYRDTLGYVLAMGEEDYSTFDTTEIRAMHYMMLRHEQTKSPGRYRKGPVYVHDERSDQIVYEGPDAATVPARMDALVESLHSGAGLDPVVRSAMAHLNLVMIHPFRDGNGRMARALATSVLTRSDIGEPESSGIEEWLGVNTEDYYAVLALTDGGSWNPRDDAVLGYRIRRSTYLKRTGVEEQTATRDLAALASAGVLMPHGKGRGRFYTAAAPLREIQQRRRSMRAPLEDPYPWMRAKLVEPPAAPPN